MAQTYSKLRQQAENAFQKTQAVIPVDDQLSKNDTDADTFAAGYSLIYRPSKKV